MNSHDFNRHSEPLSPEERALRESLARLGPHGEPSSVLDARILAAAHAAATTPSHAQRPARRWPVALGIAASLTLAVGIAWQLRPVQEAATYDEAASAPAVQGEAALSQQESAAAAVATDQARMVEVQPQSASDAGAVQAPTGGFRRESDKLRSPPRRAAQVERARAPPPAPPASAEPELVFDEPAAADAEMAPAAAPPATAAASPAQAPKAISGEARTQAAERDSAAVTAAQAREDAVAEDVPPATADSPEVREAWLQRIRELGKAGNADDARASLEEFVRRYPNHPVPDDLRALLE
jgi:hypothetical protein